jgi:hypothetical protein
MTGLGALSPEEVTYCQQATDLFNEIINGKLPLMDNSGIIIPPIDNQMMFEIDGSEQVFTDELLENYVI